MKKKYLFFVSVAYSYPILRPLQDEILRRGDEVAWFIEQGCPKLLEKNERWLRSVQAVMDYNPIAVFAPGNYIYDFFPGVKVCLFHGYPINKRGDEKDDHFSVRGWFDMYCTQGETSTAPFKELEKKYGFFKVYETGWCKADALVKERNLSSHNARPVVLYSTTFTKTITSAPYLFETIKRLAKEKEWDWIISFHPKFANSDILKKYKELAKTCPNVIFHESGLVDAELLNRADVLLSDASSVIVEYMMLDKPVVTYCNTTPGNHLLNVTDVNEVESALEKALSRPAALMEQIRAYVDRHEAHLDGESSSRVLDAVNNYIWYYQGRTRTKPWNLVRKFKLRWRVGYPLMSTLRLW
ncbi:CDP-glycerol glycerophosphotransferase family protein [Bacteroides sp.]|uniref:CDP-glycerol glycerophosphotransferase family protein n=1 Tax=Bacteroides sp. TaxID=29523 RepID=UPI00263023EB|nr:CDP-glycerol glycerophosphotransferase family protein [Bacteroides sp.]